MSKNGKFIINDVENRKMIELPNGLSREQAMDYANSYVAEKTQKKTVAKMGKSWGFNGKSLDGHFWVVRDGKIIDPEFNHYRHIGDYTKKYYKEAPLAKQKLVIEVVYRTFEEKMGYKRDSEEWSDYLLEHTAVQGACFHNAISEIYKNGGELKFGCLGLYFKNGNTLRQFRCPASSVWWIYGYGSYSKLTDFFKDAKEDVEEYWTIENE